VQKYEYVKDRAYSSMGIQHSPSKIWKMQRDAHSKQKTTKIDSFVQTASLPEPQSQPQPTQDFKLKELEETTNLIRYELLSRLESSHHLISGHQNLISYSIDSLTYLCNRTKGLLEDVEPEQAPEFKSVTHVKAMLDRQSLNIQELEKRHASDVEKYKELEQRESMNYGDLQQELLYRETEFVMVLGRLEEVLINQESIIQQLQNEVRGISLRAELEIQEKYEQMKKATEKHYEEKQVLQDKLVKETEETKKSSSYIIEDTKKAMHREIALLSKERDRLQNELSQADQLLEETRHRSKQEVAEVKKRYQQEIDHIKLEFQKEKEDLEQKLKVSIGQLNSAERMLRERELALRDKERVVLDKDRIIQERDRELEEALQYKEENYSRKLQETHSDYQRRINETHTEYQKRMQDAIDDYSRKLKSLEEAYQKKLNETYALETEQKELLSKLEDLESQLEKANTDNAWLVERLTEFGRENDYLKSQVSTPVKQVPVPVPIKNDQLYKKVWQDIKGTSQALKQFEEARDRLVQHFHTSMQ
jgi:hypothetical protein